MRKISFIGIIFFSILSVCLVHAHQDSGLRGTRVTIIREYIQPNVVCMVFRDGKPAIMNKDGQLMTMWLSDVMPEVAVVGGRTKSNESEYGSFVLHLMCYAGTSQELLSGRAAQVMQRQICRTAPIRYEYGPYMDEKIYVFGSEQFPCYMER